MVNVKFYILKDVYVRNSRKHCLMATECVAMAADDKEIDIHEVGHFVIIIQYML